MRMHRGRALLLLALVVAAAGVAVLLRPEPTPVQTATVDRGLVRVTVDEDGETRVRERYVVAAPLTGRMVRLQCEVGDSVSAGEVIAQLYPLPLDTRARAEAAGRLQAAEAAWRAAAARVEQAEAVWGEADRSLERLERIASEVRGGVADQQMDEARTAERTAALALEAARNGAESAAHEVESARAALLGSEGLAGEPTLVRAPVAGHVLRIFEECERAISAGAPIVEIGNPRDLEVVVDVLSEDAARLAVGSPAIVTPGPEADSTRGRIHLIEPSAFTKVSPLGVEEQRVNVIVRFDEGQVLLGDRYRVDASLVVVERQETLRVPVAATFRSDGGWAVFVVEEGRVRERSVELGARGRRVAEVRGGLSPGEAVVLYPSEEIRDGVRVEADGRN